MAKARPQLDKLANGKKKPMSRTSGVARRLLGRSEGIATKLKYGAPLTGSASGVKSISLKDAGEVLTSGIVTLGKKGLKFSAEGLAMALPVGKLVKAAKALSAAGKVAKSGALAARVSSKMRGQRIGKLIAQGETRNNKAIEGALEMRRASQTVYPRSAKTGPMGQPDLGDLSGRGIGLPYLTPAQIRRMQKFRNFGRDAGTRVASEKIYPRAKFGPNPFAKAAGKLPAAGSVDMVKKTAKQFGQKVSGKEAKNISRLLRGRGR